MKIFDISMDIHYGMPVYKNKDAKRPLLTVQQDFSTGSAYETRLDMDMHTGTHVDAPLHMLESGGTIESLSLDKVITRCRVLDLSNVQASIGADDLKDKNINKDEFVLLKTRNSFNPEFDFQFVYLNSSGAEHLSSAGIKGVGIDALGIERSQPDHGTHKILLGAGIVILEGLRLADVAEGEYLLFSAPLKILGAEASPVRAVLVSL